MFATGWAAPRRQSACRTADVLAFKSHNLDATIFWFRAPNFGDPAPAASPILRVIVAHDCSDTGQETSSYSPTLPCSIFDSLG